jgi:DNA uptake protein ComE-like DNA-binding protein
MAIVRSLTPFLSALVIILSCSNCSEPVRQAEVPEAAAQPEAEPVFDLNSVSLEELLAAVGKIDGLDRTVARNIIEFRSRMGFERVEDLLAVAEIGEKTFLKMRGHFRVGSAGSEKR